MDYLNNAFLYWNVNKLFFTEELLILWFIYNFFKLLLVCMINELVWPSQFFNRRHNIGYQLIRYRTYTETVLKLIDLKQNKAFYLKKNYSLNTSRFIY